mmetsp:Transcript_29384/g.60248  ORF Transcript_29384/g.60248 Transcript_29384/m.60248 type:complete len:207 (+) Transcript_29384:1344-1964(+)
MKPSRCRTLCNLLHRIRPHMHHSVDPGSSGCTGRHLRPHTRHCPSSVRLQRRHSNKSHQSELLRIRRSAALRSFRYTSTTLPRRKILVQNRLCCHRTVFHIVLRTDHHCTQHTIPQKTVQSIRRHHRNCRLRVRCSLCLRHMVHHNQRRTNHRSSDHSGRPQNDRCIHSSHPRNKARSRCMCPPRHIRACNPLPNARAHTRCSPAP